VQYISGGKVSPAGFARPPRWELVHIRFANAFRPTNGRPEMLLRTKSMEQHRVHRRHRLKTRSRWDGEPASARRRQAGQRPEDWLGLASRALDAIGDDAELGSQVAELRKAVRSFR
jgi:hypothetical protein